MAQRITKTFIDKLSLPCLQNGKHTQVFYRDSAIPGFGIRVSSGGSISFIVEKRINNKVKRHTLGRFGNLTVEQARKEALNFLGMVATGKDPAAEKKAKKAKQVTLVEVFEDYLLARKDLSPNTVIDYKRSIDDAFSDWRHKSMIDISKDMVEQRHRDLGNRSHARANNSLRLLRALFNHAKSKYEDTKGNPVILFNPVDRISDTRAWYKVERRTTLIKPHQLSAWYKATLQLKAETTRDYLHLLLFTGLRRSEASALSWDNVDLMGKTLTIHNTKNGESHTLPLSSYLMDLLTRRNEQRSNNYVFPSDSERGYLIEPKTAVKKVAELSGVTFTLHDLRRTFITIAESLDIPAYALKRLLNHKDPNDVTAGYIVSDVNRLIEPMEKISKFMLSNIGDVVGG